MNEVNILRLREHPAWAERAAAWYHAKWGIPQEAYEESIADCIAARGPVPQWYLALEGGTIVGGIGVIENDFHDRKEYSPNVCAVYVEEAYRCRGIAGQLLAFVTADMAAFGIRTLYLLTDHDSFYERYGWRYFCPAMGDGEETPSRLYIHEA